MLNLFLAYMKLAKYINLKVILIQSLITYRKKKFLTYKNVLNTKLSKAKLKLKSKPWITKAILKSIKQNN